MAQREYAPVVHVVLVWQRNLETSRLFLEAGAKVA
jgi:hypothetical protein